MRDRRLSPLSIVVDEEASVTMTRRYRIQQVANRTGIAPATLRAWERRYGIPKPLRTASSYRIYSEEEIRLIDRMIALCEQGMAPAEAARQLLAEQDTPVAAAAPGGDPYLLAVERIVDAARRLDAGGLESAVAAARGLGTPRVVFERVLSPALRQIGARWSISDIGVGHEHMATQIIERAARELLALVQPNQGAREAVLACISGEHHIVPLLGAAMRFVDCGYRTIVLGADTPPPAVEACVKGLAPAVVGLSTTVPPRGARIGQLLEQYAAACSGVPWLVGGAGAAVLQDRIEACGGLAVTGAGDEIARALERLGLPIRSR